MAISRASKICTATEAYKARRHCTMQFQNYVTDTAIQTTCYHNSYISLRGSQISFFCSCILDNLLNTEAHNVCGGCARIASLTSMACLVGKATSNGPKWGTGSIHFLKKVKHSSFRYLLKKLHALNDFFF